ncbi:MAG: tetratricopeptide repeat protein [Candidatus Ratteibacteria bacterium]|jgi:tetratricopeptide (TPR) repeat protein
MKKLIALLIAIPFITVGMYIFWQSKPGNKATLLWEQGEKKDAFSLWKESVKETPNLQWYDKLIERLIAEGEYEEAEKHCKAALTQWPDYVNFLFYLSVIQYYQNNYSDSLRTTDLVLQQTVYYPDLYFVRALDFLALSETAQARKELVREINNNPGNRRAWSKSKELANEKN